MSLARLKRSIAWKLFPWTDFSLRLDTGLRVCLMNRGDFPIMQEIFVEESYTPFIQALPQINTWVDIGCNCGLFTLFMENWARKHAWPGPRRALLIDPNRYAIRTARASLKINSLESQFRLFEGAVAARTKEVPFYESKSTYKSSVYALSSKEKARVVPVVDLTKETAGLGTIDLVKVDIEGGEKLLVEHWGDFLKTARYLLIEWHEPHMSGTALNKICEGLGFELLLARPPAYLKNTAGAALDQCIGTGLWKNRSM